jgi:class 3 adenylate cyclase/predicted ATPase
MFKRQFDLDDDYLEDLKDAILFAHPVVDEDGRGLVWTGDTVAPEPEASRETDAQFRFHAILPVLTGLLQREGRVTYGTLKQVFSLDEGLLGNLREELIFKGLAQDQDGKGLVWTGKAQPFAPHAAPTRSSATSETTPATPAVTADSTRPIPDIITAHDEHRALLDTSRTSPEAERRQLTVMFCDIADSTILSQQLDPEDLREVVRAYQATAAEVIQQYEGHMAQYLGDGLLIYFGWPVAHEDDAQRSLHAGLGIVQAITTTLNPRLEQEKGVQLAVRIGIHTGPVVVGEMGGGERHENLATGETVNIASRLEGLAPSNTVLISNITARLVRDAFALEDLGPHELKGVVESMHVSQVRGPVEVHEDESMPDGGRFLVGRDEEVGLLLRRWEQSKEGLGQVVLIGGEAGIGKSSLVATVRHHVVQEGHTRIAFRCSPYHTNSALYPIIAHLEQMLGFERDDTPGTRLDKLEQVLRMTNLPLGESVPLLATLLSVPLEDRYPAPTLSPQQQRQQTLDALVAWLMEESEKQPVLALWEDLHWADPSTLEMLGLVLEQTPTVPMLNVLTFRPEFTLPWPTRSHMTPITLNRLERLQVEALISHLTDNKTLPEEVVEHIVTKTDGVPLYVEELTKMLMESDLLREGADRYVLTGPLLSVPIPDTLQDSLMARLDQMQAAKEVAQIGSVLGREFTYEMLRAVMPQDAETVQSGLAQLVAGELLYHRGRPPRSTYIFKHALIQDTAYASLLRSTRQQVHRQLAQLLKASFPETVETQPELVAYHYAEADDGEQAIAYWQRAGQRALQRLATHEAISHLSAGLELLSELSDTPEHMHQELEIQMALGPALMVVKGFGAPEVEQTYDRARTLCAKVGETPQLFPVLWGLRQFYNGRAELQPARELGEQLLSLAQHQRDPALLQPACAALGMTLFFLGEFVLARNHLEQGIALVDTEAQRALAMRYGVAPKVLCLAYAAWVLWFLGYPDQAKRQGLNALSLARELDHPYSLASALTFTLGLYRHLRDEYAAEELLETLNSIASEHGFAQRLATELTQRGWVSVSRGHVEEGIALMRQGLSDLKAMGLEIHQPLSLPVLALAYGKLGQIDEGLGILFDAEIAMDQTSANCPRAELHWCRGELFLLQTPPDACQAESCFQQALNVARRQQAKSWELRAATSLARLWQSQGKHREAYELLHPVYSWFTEGFDTADLKEAKALLQELAR